MHSTKRVYETSKVVRHTEDIPKKKVTLLSVYKKLIKKRFFLIRTLEES